MSAYIRWLIVMAFAACPFALNASATEVKMETIDVGELATGRPSKINVWFPHGSCANLEAGQLCLAESAVTDKAIIFSHGAMGAAGEYSWIGESLAAAGYVVVGVNHFGESWVYGQEAINPRSTGFIWQRPQDISALLDYLATKNIFQKKINWSNIIAIGHSAGGQTAAMLAGATFDLKQLIAYCDSNESKGDRSCNYGSNKTSVPEAFLQKFSASQQDLRIKMIVMLDPALGSAVQPESLHAVKLPSFVVGTKNNDFLPWNNHGLRYANNIPNATTKLLTGDEGHFVFLTACNNKIKVMDVPLCEDRAGVDRKAIQQELSQDILKFINQSNAAFFTQSSVTVPTKNYSKSNVLFEIISYTPKWVFGLLGMLVVFGVMQTRTRQVRIQVALILPILMLLLSLTGVLRYIGWQLPALVCWIVGITVVTALSIKLIGKNIAHFDSKNQKLTIEGSWLPLIVILGIFITRYALGVATAMDFRIIHEDYFPLVVSLILGAWSGFFIARGFIFWFATKNIILIKI
jgi:predicted dienelactone hydrolase